MIKVYVCGGSDERLDVVRPLIDRLTRAGVEVTHDWTRCEGYDRPSTDAERVDWARQDLDGVKRADVVWYVAPHNKSEGSTGEFCAAYALGKTVICSGPHALKASRIFSLLCTHYDTHESAYDALLRMAMTPQGARDIIGGATATWSDADLIRLATLIQLGRPADVVYGHPSEVRADSTKNEKAIRPVASEELTLRADVFHMWRMVSRYAKVPL